MTVASSGEASRSMLLPPPLKKGEDKEGHGSSSGRGAPGWAVDGRDQENGASLGRVIAVEGLGGLLRQPEMAVVAVELPPQRVQEPANPEPFPRIHEQANCENVDRKYRVVYKADRRKKCLTSPGGSDGEKIRRCDLAVAFHGQEVGRQMGREAASAAAAIPEGAGPAVGQVLTKMQQLLKNCSSDNGKNKKELDDVHVVHMKQAAAVSHELKNLHSQQAEAAHGKITNQSDCKIKNEPSESCMSSIVGFDDDGHFSGLSTRLQRLGISFNNVTPILSKNVPDTDCDPNQSRLLLPRVAVKGSPLLRMLTPMEYSFMQRKSSALPIEVVDRYGCSYDMVLKYLSCNDSYRLIGDWRKFLALSHMITGDLVKLGAFRFEGQLVLTLLHYGNAGKAKELISTVTEKSKEELASRETEANDEERASRAAEANDEEWNSVELEVAGALLMLSDSGDQPEPQ